jgi:hypothetical protein
MDIMTNSDLVNLSIRCEHIIRAKFTSLADNRYSDIKMFTYGGIVLADSIRTKGGLYVALVSTLARCYEDKEKMIAIDNFIDKYCYIEDKELGELSKECVESILTEFKEILI